jgi:N-acetylglucosamine-6-phosphate deacetylase
LLALTNCRIYTATDSLDGHAVLVKSGRIADVVGEVDIPAGAERLDLAGGHLAPGFIDIQVNGGGGVMFDASPDVMGIARIGMAHRRFGTTGFLPTLITGERGKIALAIDAVAEALAAGAPGLLGIHLEGPLINPERRGMHPEAQIAMLTEDDIARLAALPAQRLVTLAPECAPPGLIARLSAAGIRVLAGHTQATAEEIAAAKAEGLVGVTHLFNAMSGFQGRAPGTVGAALADADLWCGIIADGVHVHDASIRAAWRAKRDKLMLVTDAMAPVGTDMTGFTQGGQEIAVRDGSCFLADGRLAGSTLDMARAVRHCVHRVALPLDEALRMAATYPAEFLGLGATKGRIAAGYDADLVLLDEGLTVRASWIKGDMERHD